MPFMPASESLLRPAQAWRDDLLARFETLGLARELAENVVDPLLEAELWGRPTHGFMRVPGVVKAVRRGLTGFPKIEAEGSHFARIDGSGSLGYAVSALAVKVAAEKARACGVGVVSCRHSAHNGMLGYWSWKLACAGLVGFNATQCLPSVAAFGSNEAVLGTNPLAWGFPAAGPDGDPVVIDLATSAINYGEINLRARAGKSLPEGVALDAAGRVTTDASQVATVLPMGGPVGEGKGAALGLAVELLCSVLVGAPPFPKQVSDYGHLFVALKPGAFAGENEYAAGMKAVAERIHGLAPRPGQETPRLPGERAFAHRRKALKEGLRVDPAIWAEAEGAFAAGQD